MSFAMNSMATGNVERALTQLHRAYRVFQQIGDARSQAIALENIGSIYAVARDYNNALDYYAQAKETFSGDPALLITLDGNRGTAFRELARLQEARREFEDALRIANQIGSPLYRVRVLTDLTTTELAAGDVDAAEQYIARAFALAANTPLGDWTPALYGAAAEVALRRHQLDRAASLIRTAFAGQDIDKANISLRDALRTAYQIYKARHDDDRALAFLEAYKRVDDNARAVAASTSAALMSARFDFANQNLKISQLRAGEAVRDAAIARARARLRSTILIGLLVAASVITTLLLIGFFSIRHSRDQVRAANRELSSTNVALEKALAARTEFLATTSHEIRTPLNGILGMTQVLLADRALDGDVRGKIELVHGAGETMRALVDDLLDVAKMATGELTVHRAPMALGRLMRDAGQVWADQAAARGIGLVLAIDDCPERIVEDEMRLRQIVFNLMSNAIKFTDQGEVRLTVHTRPDRGPAAAPGAERLEIVVADTGIGIPADKIEEIFESFRQVDGGVTRRHGGTGLGLAICRNLARALGGDVRVESVLGAGSTFTLDLPLERLASPAAAAAGNKAAAASLGEARVLLVEANPLSQSVLRALLTPLAAAVTAVPSLDEARATLAAAPIDLVLADGATMGLDMAAVAALAAEVTAHGALLALMWPAPDEAIRTAAREAGVTLMIAKPLAAPDLVSALKGAYGKAGSPAGLAA